MSAFSPIANPINCPWGQKAFSNYLGADQKEAWKEYDTVELLKKLDDIKVHALVDVVSKERHTLMTEWKKLIM